MREREFLRHLLADMLEVRREQVLFAFVILDDEEFDDGFGQEFLSHNLAVVRQCELYVK